MISPITGFMLVVYASVPTSLTNLGNFPSEESCLQAKKQVVAMAKKGFTIVADCVPGVIVAVTNIPDNKQTTIKKKKEPVEEDTKQKEKPAEEESPQE